jgi:hypothetical protein
VPNEPIRRGGILSEPLDLDDDGRRRHRPPPQVEAPPGLRVTQRGSGIAGAVVSFGQGTVVVRCDDGRDRTLKLLPGGFDVDGRQVTLVPPRAAATAAGVTASGSVALRDVPARTALASRIYVEGVHDAELVEHVWGDDLRVEGIVVQPMHGADDLEELVRGFVPRPGRRLGILLDHLVPGSKESRLAERVQHPDVLICGHPFVDVWAAVRPTAVGIEAWPDVPKGQPWKEGICAALGVDDPPRFWKRVLGSVTTYADLDPSLVGAVEQLIDFVTEPAPG